MLFRHFAGTMKAVFVLSALVLVQFSHVPIHAAGTAIVGVDAPTPMVGPGQRFVINIGVNPNNEIAGAQFSLSFNPSLVNVDNVAEGNLLRQAGAKTYFTSGQINNSAGTVSAIAGAIISPGQTVSTAGTLAVVAMTAKGTAGTCPLNISSVIVGDINGRAIPTNVVNGQVVVSGANAPPPPAPVGGGTVSGGGGFVGGASGGGGPTVPGVTNLAMYTDDEGLFKTDGHAESADGLAHLAFTKGVNARNADGTALKLVSITPMEETPTSPADGRVFGLTYRFGPEGAQFSPAATLTFVLDRKTLAVDTALENLRIGRWDGDSWETLDSRIDTVAMTISADLSHFSVYAILYAEPIAPTPTVPAAPTQAPAPTAAPVETTMPAPAESAPTQSDASLTTTMESTTTTDNPPSDPVPVFRLSLLALAIAVAASLAGVAVILALVRRRSLVKKGARKILHRNYAVAHHTMTLGLLSKERVSIRDSRGKLDGFSMSVVRDVKPQSASERSLATNDKKRLDSFVQSVVQDLTSQSEVKKPIVSDDKKKLDSFAQSVLKEVKMQSASEKPLVSDSQNEPGEFSQNILQNATQGASEKPLVTDDQNTLDNFNQSIVQDTTQSVGEKPQVSVDQNRPASFTEDVLQEIKPQSASEEYLIDMIVSRLSSLGRLSWKEPESTNA